MNNVLLFEQKSTSKLHCPIFNYVCQQLFEIYTVTNKIWWFTTWVPIRRAEWGTGGWHLSEQCKKYLAKVDLQALHMGLNSYLQYCTGFWASNMLLNSALQRHYTDNSKQIFPEMKLCALSPISCIQLYVSFFVFPWSVCLFCSRKIGGPIVGIYKSLTETWMWKLELRLRSFYSGSI